MYLMVGNIIPSRHLIDSIDRVFFILHHFAVQVFTFSEEGEVEMIEEAWHLRRMDAGLFFGKGVEGSSNHFASIIKNIAG